MVKRIFSLSDGCKPTEDLYFRNQIPSELKKRGFVEEHYINCNRTRPDSLLKRLNSQDSIMFFRTLPTIWVDYLPELVRSSKLQIYILDDNLRAAAKTLELPQKYKQRISHFAKRHHTQLLENASHLVVSSNQLCAEYKVYSPKLLHPSLLIDTEKQSFDISRKMSICYHATRSHERDLSFLAPVLENTLKSKEISFESLIGDSTPQSLSELKNVRVRQPKSWQSFKRFQHFAKRNIGLAPLLDTPYNRAKSHIKFLDYAAVGAVGIYSNREPYSLIVEHGVDGFLANDKPEEWQAHIEFLISNPDIAKNMASNAKKKAFEIGHPKHAYRFWRKLIT